MPIKPLRRKLNRTPSHRRSLLRNIVSCLIIYESIETTFSKAKEAQKIADRLITYAKKGLNNPFLYKRIESIKPEKTIPKLRKIVSERFLERPGGYTRVLKLPSRKSDSAPMAVLEYIDGPKDTRFLMTVKTMINNEKLKKEISEKTMKNIKKAICFRKDGLTTFKNIKNEFYHFFNAKKEKT
ncbi:ribosomal protein L17 [Pneumocystis murina B123]|uniref:Ribosomal protein L17 n=1 Tax=Pneumocystis murina (strain B123) TaxID=1069680 RepID=M7NMI4_PNEMU|nr:ribosomal protein L17 [Pneumocystis murina B123]EMR09883.1 ribosomal protein L17 [Pneumocystis murina B123]